MRQHLMTAQVLKLEGERHFFVMNSTRSIVHDEQYRRDTVHANSKKKNLFRGLNPRPH